MLMLQSIIKKLKRFIKNTYQRWTKCYTDEELWNLDKTICKFVLPRLKAFRERTDCFPPNIEYEEWLNRLDEMIEAFELASTYDILNEDDFLKVQKGLLVFGWNFQYLWW